jgi:hypothetical protein
MIASWGGYWKTEIAQSGGFAMDLKDRFFGKGSPEAGGLPVANLSWQDPPSFQLLYPAPLELDASALTQTLRDYHRDLADATAELIHVPAPPPMPGETTSSPPGVMGLAGWGRHVVKIVGFDAPMSASVLDRTVRVAHYPTELKDAAYRHEAHVLLHYAGYESDVLEQHVALAATAAALARFGALVTMNQTARTSIPSPALLPHEEDAGDTLKAMRELPLLFLYAGMVAIEPENEPGYWVRTYGCPTFSLPDLAIRPGPDENGEALFHLLGNLLAHMREAGQIFFPGDSLQAGGRLLRVRDPGPDEWFLRSKGRILVLEPEIPAEARPA